MDLDLAGKTAVVTGASKGIGKAIAETFAAEGCRVAICARNQPALDATVAEFEKNGQTLLASRLDVQDRAAVKAWVDDVAEQTGGVDILVANVSAFPGRNEPEDWRLGFDVDLMGTLNPIDAAMPHFGNSDAPAVVVIGSTASVDPMGPGRPYDVYKAALVTYVKSMCLAHAGDGIRFNTVSPGTVYFEGGRWDNARQNDPARYEHYLARNPMGRMGTPRDVANAAVFLASPAASFITGTNLIVDGAFTRRVQL
jgi:3-oxoacyl-[acyl-carrier protein] reductase